MKVRLYQKGDRHHFGFVPIYNGGVNRRTFVLALLPVIPCLSETSKTIRGRLTQRPGKQPALETSDRKFVVLEGDQPTMGVLNDKRLNGADLEVIGRFTAPDLLVVDPIHTRALFVHKDSKKLLITYWCDVCSIRYYTPGACWCCQQDTQLDLRDPDRP